MLAAHVYVWLGLMYLSQVVYVSGPEKAGHWSPSAQQGKYRMMTFTISTRECPGKPDLSVWAGLSCLVMCVYTEQ